MRRLNQRGDTIVEVLICIAIVGMILAGAFVVSNRSQLGVRNSQEHAEASKLIEGQLEQLRSNSSQTNSTIFTYAVPPEGFCMDGAAAPIPATDERCKVGNDGRQSDTPEAYSISIKRATSGSGTGNTGRVFTIEVRWASISGLSVESFESMNYRLYP